MCAFPCLLIIPQVNKYFTPNALVACSFDSPYPSHHQKTSIVANWNTVQVSRWYAGGPLDAPESAEKCYFLLNVNQTQLSNFHVRYS